MALVRNATMADQDVLETTLGSVVADIERTGFSAPAIIVLGEVVRLRAGLDWLGALGGRVLEADPLARTENRAVG